MTTVRPELARDAAAAVQVVRRSITELCVSDHHGDAATLAGWLANKTVGNFHAWVADPDNFCVVAEADGQAAGVGLVHRSGEIRLFYLAPGAQRHGIGRTIHAALETQARTWGLRTLRLRSTFLARPFYVALGYQASGAARPCSSMPSCYPYEKSLG